MLSDTGIWPHRWLRLYLVVVRNLRGACRTHMPGLVSVRPQAARRHVTQACVATSRLAVTLFAVVTVGTITPLAHVIPPDPTWIAGFYDNADHDDAVIAVVGVECAPNSGRSVFFPWIQISQFLTSPHPARVTSHQRLTLADRAPPLR